MAFQIDFRAHLAERKKKHSALYHALRERIASGTSAVGELLPSTRELAASYGLSRGTVTLVYEMLAADGYIELNERRSATVSYQGPRSGNSERRSLPLSEWAGRLMPQSLSDSTSLPHFLPGLTDRRIFPEREWNRSMLKALRSTDSVSLHPAGHGDLRERIAAHLRHHRNIQATAENTVIVNGSTQAITLLCHLLLNKGDTGILEDPGFGGTKSAILATGARVFRIPVDDQGINTSLLKRSGKRARLAFVTPTHQFPTGVVLSSERRQRLVEWAEANGSIIVEDDYDSEFRRKIRPLEPLRGLAPQSVVYVGTFSRTLSLSLRLGYVTLPNALVDPFLRAKQIFESHSSAWVEQRALAEFMGAGHYERHLRRMTRIYRQRHDALLHAFRKHMPRAFEFTDSDAGLHLFGRWQHGVDKFRRFFRLCSENGPVFRDAGLYYDTGGLPSAVFSFAHIAEQESPGIVSRMAKHYRAAINEEASYRPDIE